jgi:hypothetical protein
VHALEGSETLKLFKKSIQEANTNSNTPHMLCDCSDDSGRIENGSVKYYYTAYSETDLVQDAVVL